MKKILLQLLIITICSHLYAQPPGSLDSSFGSNGKSFIQYEGYLTTDAILLRSGSILQQSNNFMMRILPDGRLDSSFGENGKVYYDDNDIFNSRALAEQPDGKIVAGGYNYSFNEFYDVALQRYNADGSPDKSFGDNGKIQTDLNGGDEAIHDLLIQPDGKIVATGRRYKYSIGSHPFLIRYNSDGTLDKAFGNGGSLISEDISGYCGSIALAPDGKIITGGYYFTGSYLFMVLRYTKEGILDSTFDRDGMATAYIGYKNDYLNDVAVQADGKIVGIGSDNEVRPIFNVFMAAVRFNEDGTLDNGFGNKGTLNIPLYGSIGNRVALQQNGKILMSGSTTKFGSTDFLLIRLLTDGSYDTGFGDSGIVVTDFGYNEAAENLLLAGDGKILATGFSSDANETFTAVALAKYVGDPVKQQSPIAKRIRRWIRNHTLQWQPLNDDDIAYYSIQQSSNGVNGFKEIGRVSQNSKVKSKNEEAVYSFSLNNASSSNIQNSTSNINYYRITAVSTTGSNINSDVIADENISSITISPNPVKDVMKISGLPAGVKSTINIINRNGNVLLSAISNSSTYSMNISQLQSGLYNVQVVNNGKTQTVKLVKE